MGQTHDPSLSATSYPLSSSQPALVSPLLPASPHLPSTSPTSPAASPPGATPVDSEDTTPLPSEVLSAILPVPGSVASAGPASDFPFDCQYCGCIEEGHFFADTKRSLLARHACFNCTFWLNLADKPHPPTAPTDHSSFYFTYLNREGELVHMAAKYCPKKPTPTQLRQNFCGFGGAHFCLLFKDGTTYTSHDVWHQGTIPDIFRHLFTPHVINLHHK